MMTLTIKSDCTYVTLEQWRDSELETIPDSQRLRIAETVEYRAHVPRGMVKVRHQGQDVIIHPLATIELSERKDRTMSDEPDTEDDTVYCATCGKPRDPRDVDSNGDCVPCRVRIFEAGERRP